MEKIYATNRLEKTLLETHKTLKFVRTELFNQAVDEKDVFYRQIINEAREQIARALIEIDLIYDRCLITRMFEEE